MKIPPKTSKFFRRITENWKHYLSSKCPFRTTRHAVSGTRFDAFTHESQFYVTVKNIFVVAIFMGRTFSNHNPGPGPKQETVWGYFKTVMCKSQKQKCSLTEKMAALSHQIQDLLSVVLLWSLGPTKRTVDHVVLNRIPRTSSQHHWHFLLMTSPAKIPTQI